MGIHPPKELSIKSGLGLKGKVSSKIEWQESVGILTEIWDKLETAWTESGYTIADEGFKWVSTWEIGKNYIISKLYDKTGNHVADYYDITSTITRNNNDICCRDWYLDVWKPSGSDPVLLDEEDLTRAVDANYLSTQEAECARIVAQELINSLY